MLLTSNLLQPLEQSQAIDRQPLIVSPDTRVGEAITCMSQCRASCALVVEQQQLVGIFTERDVVRIAASGMPLSEVAIAQVMTQNPITLCVEQEQDIYCVLSLLRQHQRSHLPVVDELGQVVGVITWSTIVDALDPIEMYSTREILQQEVVEQTAQLRLVNEQLQQQTRLRQQAEAAKRSSEEKFKKAFRSSPVPIAISRLKDTRFIEVNDSFLELYGYERNDVIGHTASELNILVNLEDRVKLIQLVQETGGVRNQELDIRTSSGEVKTVLVAAELIDIDGQACLLAIANDITERKLAEEKLKKSEANLAAAQRVAHIGSWEFDVLTGEITWSEEKFRIYGLDPTKPEPTYAELIELVHPDDRASFQQAVSRVLADGTSYEVEYRILQSDSKAVATSGASGQVRHIEARGEAVFNQQKQVIKLRGTALDITERKLTQEALCQSAATNRALLNAIPDMIFHCRADGTYVDFKPAKDIKTIMPPSMFIGKKVQEILSPELAQRVLFAQKQAILSGQTQTLEYQLAFDDQLLHDYEARIVAINSDEVIAIVRDISSRKQAEAALKESEVRFRGIFESAAIGIGLTGADGKLIEVNPTLAAFLGYSSCEMLALPFANITHPDDRATDSALTKEVIDGLRDSFQIEKRYIRKDGQLFWGRVTVSAVRNSKGEFQFTVAMLEDITFRKKALERLRLLESVVVNANDAVLITQAEPVDFPGPRIIYVNEAFTRMTGYTREEVIGKTPRILQGPKTDRTMLRKIHQALLTWQSIRVELLNYRKDGSQFWVEFEIVPVADETGWFTHWVSVQRDITERKLAEEALQQSTQRFREKAQELELALSQLKRTQAQLIQTEKMSSLGQLVAGVAHEINNPVSFIYGNLTPAREYFQDLLKLVQLYQQTYPDSTPEIQQVTSLIDLDFLVEDWQQLMNSMQVGAERILQIVRSLLLFSRQNESQVKPVDIYESIDNTLLILQHRLRAKGERPSIEVIKDYGQLPLVTCYASQLNQVLMNLLSNAIDALENQPSPRVITISTSVVSSQWSSSALPMPQMDSGIQHQSVVSSCEQKATDKGQLATDVVVIRIADNGLGMSEEVLRKIFDPFFTTKSVGSGAGLGLAISYQIVVERHFGQISCISAPGQGTEFIVEIPVNLMAHPNPDGTS